MDYAHRALPSANYRFRCCRDNVTASGIRWAYRRNMEESKDLDKDKRPVLLLHGLGSASFSYRQFPPLADDNLPDCCITDTMGCLGP